ncbi:MAG TPA: MerR family transcriptional regulator [Actinomycetota bacterium]|nr:MerR family transcriptional regulator [Actinomycetota bacterium]
MEQGYRGPQACKIVGITYRQLDYWARTALVTPSLKDADGSGTQRMYSFRDLVHLKVIKSLLDAGVNLPQIRKAIAFLNDGLKSPIDKVTLLSDGRTVYAATSDRQIVDLLKQGQGVIGLALGKVYEDLQGALRTMLPQGAEAGESGSTSRPKPVAARR